jgi:hypothetical protein
MTEKSPVYTGLIEDEGNAIYVDMSEEKKVPWGVIAYVILLVGIVILYAVMILVELNAV